MLVDRNTGDVIASADHNEIKDYIEDGAYRVKTKYILLEPGSEPSVAQGEIYFNSSSDRFYASTDGSNFVNIGAQKYVVTPKTSDYSVTVQDCDGGSIFTNGGSSGTIVFDLPSAVAGYKVIFVNVEGNTIAIHAAAGDNITTQGTTELALVINSTAGNSITLVAVNDTEWITVADEGSWSPVTPGSKTLDTDSYILKNYSQTRDSDVVISALIFPYGFCAGYTSYGSPTRYSNIYYFDNNTATGNAADGGDLSVARAIAGSNHGNSYGFVSGGSTSGAASNVIEYFDITITDGNASDKGDLISATNNLYKGVNGNTLGFVGGGEISGSPANNLQYVTLDTTTGNAADGGDLSSARLVTGVTGQNDIGFFGGGNLSNVIDYFDTSITNDDAADKGDLTVARYKCGSSSGTSYGFFFGGTSPSLSNVIDYIDITTTTGDASDKGDLTEGKFGIASSGAKGGSYGYACGGETSSAADDAIEYIDINTTTGNSADKGTMPTGTIYGAGI